MANAKIDVISPSQMEIVTDLHNQIFKPARKVDAFHRRFLGRHDGLIMVAAVEERPVGFALGFELKPGTFFEWLYGVLPDYRRQAIGSQLMEAVHAWARHKEYETMRLECHNGHRPMLHMAIRHHYDVVGIRWDGDRGENLVIFEKMLDRSV